MKKLVSLLFLLVFSIFLVGGQPKVTSYVDSVKNVNINVNSDARQKVFLEDLQSELIEAQNNQTAINTSMISTFAELQSETKTLGQTIEERNKSDSKLITDIFSYTPERVKQVIRKERWLNFITYLLCVFYILFVLNQLAGRYTNLGVFNTKIVFYILYGLLGFWVFNSILTLLFNGDYYVIKELMNLYT
jgi:hypothetical protein